MNVADACDQWLKARALAKDAERDKKEAEIVLKAWFAKTGKPSYAGRIAHSVSIYRALDSDLARAALGKKVAACEVVRTRETLTPL